jgi:acetyltransferase EpsM
MKSLSEKIIIIGGRGTAVIIAEQIYDASNRFNAKVEVLGFAIDDPAYGSEINGFPILCATREVKNKYANYNDVKIIYSLYRPDVMKERIELLKSYEIPEEKFATFVHPSALITKSAEIGVGSVILANAVVNSNAYIGIFNTINSNCLIGHDSKINNYNYFAAHVCIGSNLSIGNGNFFGMNSNIRNFLKIKDYNIIGMGSNVVKDVESSSVLYGNPAQSVEKLNNMIR